MKASKIRATAGILLGALALAGCQSMPGDSAAVSETKQSSGVPRLCESDEQLDCRQLDSGQWIAVVGQPNEQGVVVLDAGGPGDNGSESLALRASLPPSLADRAAVVLFEPWTYSPYADRCREEFAAVSWGKAPADDRTCLNVVQALETAGRSDLAVNIEAVVGERVSAVVAFSFGAPRTMPLWADLEEKDDTLIVMSPAAPAGTNADEVVYARSRAVESLLGQIQENACGTGTACPALADLLALTVQETQWPGADVSGPEVGMFLFAASADPEQFTESLTEVATGAELSEQTQATITRLALSFSRAVDEEHALPSNSGFRSEMCAAYGATDIAEDEPLAGVFARQLGPCTAVLPWPEKLTRTIPEQACLIVNRQDRVAPSQLTAEYRELFPAEQTLEHDASAHRAPAAVLAGLKLEGGCSR